MNPLRRLIQACLGSDIQAGDRFLVRRPFETTVLTHWKAPFTDGFRAVLPAGTRLVAADPARLALGGCVFVPEDREAFEMAHVPEPDRLSEKFAGVSVPLTARRIRTSLEPVPAATGGEGEPG